MSPDVTRIVTSQRLPLPRGKSILCKSWPLSPTIAPTIFPFTVSQWTRNAAPRGSGKARVSVQYLGVSREVRSFTQAIAQIERTVHNRHFEIAAAVSDL